VSPDAPAPPTPGPGTLALVTASVCGFATSITMVGPLLLDIGRDLEVSLGTAGLLATAMALPWALGAPVLGALSDRVGRRPLIVTALAGVGVASLLGAAAPGFPALLASRFLAGLFGAAGPPSLMAAVGDLFPPRRRAMAMGWFNMGFSAAALLGAPAAAVVGGWLGWRAAFAATGLGLVALAGLARLTFPAGVPRRPAAGPAAPYRAVLAVPGIGPLLGANLLERTLFFMATLYLPPLLMTRYGLTAAAVAPALVLIAAGGAAGNVAGGWLGARLAAPRLFALAQGAAGAVGAALFAWTPGLGASCAAGVAFGAANAASRPGLLAFGSELAPARRGAVLGLLGVSNQTGVVAGSALGGLVLEWGGFGPLGGGLALLAALAVVLALRLRPGPAAAA
jgi:DHA1 family inner membrane transport protein